MFDSLVALQLIKENKIRFPILIWGEETYLRDRIKRDLINTYLDKRLLTFNYEEIKENGQNLSKIFELLVSPPILSPNRMIFVHLDIFSTSEINQLAQKISSLPVSSSLFVGYSQSSPPKELLKVVSDKSGMIIKVNRPPTETLKQIFKNLISSRDKTISQEALDFLIQDKRNLQYLRMEIEKVLLFAHDKNEITLDDLLKVYSIPEEEDIFPLMDTLFEGKIAKNLKILNNFLSQGEYPSLLISRLASQIRSTYKVSHLNEKESGLHPYFYKKLKNYSRRIKPYLLESALVILAQTDEKLKSGKADPIFLVNQAFLKIGLLWRNFGTS